MSESSKDSDEKGTPAPDEATDLLTKRALEIVQAAQVDDDVLIVNVGGEAISIRIVATGQSHDVLHQIRDVIRQALDLAGMMMVPQPGGVAAQSLGRYGMPPWDGPYVSKRILGAVGGVSFQAFSAEDKEVKVGDVVNIPLTPGYLNTEDKPSLQGPAKLDIRPALERRKAEDKQEQRKVKVPTYFPPT